jgi:hypothetical protein
MMLKWPLKGVAFVTGEGPERAADDGEAADCSDKGRDERDNEEADGRCIGPGSFRRGVVRHGGSCREERVLRGLLLLSWRAHVVI